MNVKLYLLIITIIFYNLVINAIDVERDKLFLEKIEDALKNQIDIGYHDTDLKYKLVSDIQNAIKKELLAELKSKSTKSFPKNSIPTFVIPNNKPIEAPTIPNSKISELSNLIKVQNINIPSIISSIDNSGDLTRYDIPSIILETNERGFPELIPPNIDIPNIVPASTNGDIQSIIPPSIIFMQASKSEQSPKNLQTPVQIPEISNFKMPILFPNLPSEVNIPFLINFPSIILPTILSPSSIPTLIHPTTPITLPTLIPPTNLNPVQAPISPLFNIPSIISPTNPISQPTIIPPTNYICLPTNLIPILIPIFPLIDNPTIISPTTPISQPTLIPTTTPITLPTLIPPTTPITLPILIPPTNLNPVQAPISPLLNIPILTPESTPSNSAPINPVPTIFSLPIFNAKEENIDLKNNSVESNFSDLENELYIQNHNEETSDVNNEASSHKKNRHMYRGKRNFVFDDRRLNNINNDKYVLEAKQVIVGISLDNYLENLLLNEAVFKKTISYITDLPEENIVNFKVIENLSNNNEIVLQYNININNNDILNYYNIDSIDEFFTSYELVSLNYISSVVNGDFANVLRGIAADNDAYLLFEVDSTYMSSFSEVKND